VAAANLMLAHLAGARAAVAARRRGADWILSVADHGFSVIGADVCARLSGLPHIIWVFDLWEENAYSDVDRRLARRFERGIWRRAAAIIVHADELAAHYRRKHGVTCTVLPTPIDLVAADGAARRRHEDGGALEVLYAGAVYWAQEEAIRRLIAACSTLHDVRLTMVADPASLRAAGIVPDRVEPTLPHEAFRSRVGEADVAVVCLSFRSPHPDVIATATPARLPEFMASGTPIVVHAPPGSHVAEYARRHDFAEVVDVPDRDALARGLRRALDDTAVSSMRARRARDLAVERHDAGAVRGRLRDLLAATRSRSGPPPS
jgi:glycosyltransferase involved in cell wall biosynthesis